MNARYTSPRLSDPDDPADRDARRNQPPVDMDMNPMVDMAFLLLTFFMLATTFSQPRTMEIVMPPKPEPQQELLEQPIKESKALTLILGNDDNVHWYRGVSEPQLHTIFYGADGLQPLLVRLNSEVSELVVLIKPLPDSRYENLVDVLDDLTLAGIERYALVAPTAADEALYLAGSTLQRNAP
ncbi:MAG: biopolymer transporter ExbD [Bacteroidetes bacterium]|nr:biopolymer transporter ExbD [Bacteroidota bacterium]